MKTYKASVLNMNNELLTKEGHIEIEASSVQVAANKVAKLLNLKECTVQLFSKAGKLTATINIF